MKLSPAQKKALEKVASRSGGSAYSLGLTLGTLNSLALKGLVSANRSGLGCLFSPRVGIAWYITDAGRDAHRTYAEQA